MNLYSLTFIYLFLPAAALLYYAVPARAKNPILLVVSLAFYSMAEPRYLLLLVGAVLFDYAANLLLERYRANTLLCRALVLTVLTKNALLVLLYSAFTPNRELWRPLGLMICAVTSGGYTVDLYRGEAECTHSPVDFGLFCLFFGKLPAGPLVRWNEFQPQLQNRRSSLSMVSDGILLYIQGLAKKVLLGNNMTALYDQFKAFPMQEQSIVSSWMMTAALAFAVYFNLSSLCDMARGIAQIFSIELPRNFYYPYQSRSVTEFVSRFNMTVTDFFRAYVPKPPLGSGSYTGTAMVLNIALVTLLWGAWFGFKVNFLIWGLYFVLFQLLEQLAFGTFLRKLPALLARLYTFAVVLLSFVIFAGNSVDQSIGYFKAMLGLGGTRLYTEEAMYIASSNYMLLLFALLLCTSLVNGGLRLLRKKAPELNNLVGVALGAVLLVVSTAFLVV